jgi:hypothetical protein
MPALFQMEMVPTLLMGPLANIELLIAFVHLTGSSARSLGDVPRRSCCKIDITPTIGSLVVKACLQQLRISTPPANRVMVGGGDSSRHYCNFAYSALASFRMGLQSSFHFTQR